MKWCLNYQSIPTWNESKRGIKDGWNCEQCNPRETIEFTLELINRPNNIFSSNTCNSRVSYCYQVSQSTVEITFGSLPWKQVKKLDKPRL